MLHPEKHGTDARAKRKAGCPVATDVVQTEHEGSVSSLRLERRRVLIVRLGIRAASFYFPPKNKDLAQMALSFSIFDLLTLSKNVSWQSAMRNLPRGQVSEQVKTQVFCALCLIFLGIKMRLP